MDLNPVDIENSETYANWQGASVAYAVLALSIDGVAVSRPAHPQVISVWLPNCSLSRGGRTRKCLREIGERKNAFCLCVFVWMGNFSKTLRGLAITARSQCTGSQAIHQWRLCNETSDIEASNKIWWSSHHHCDCSCLRTWTTNFRVS